MKSWLDPTAANQQIVRRITSPTANSLQARIPKRMQRNSDIERGFRPQLHYFSMIFLWLALLATALLYFAFVKLDIWRPHFAWWLLTLGLIVFAIGIASLLVFARIVRRSRIAWGIGIWMITMTPIVIFGAFIWLVFSLSQSRGDMQLSLPVRAFGIWVGNYFDVEARWKNPRITLGEHVELFHDDDVEDPQTMVQKMDQHVLAMAKTLGVDPTEWSLAWCRSKLGGQSGRAVGLWAICPFDKNDVRNQSANEPGFVDHHEVAHTFITSLCGIDQEPPMLLVEGWAMARNPSQPVDMVELKYERATDQSWSLMDLVSDKFYGRSIGPCYRYGGPLVTYLLERFGGPRFLELYGNVRRPTFLADAERILGVSWQQLDHDFWTWLDQQQAELPENVRFANEALKPRWHKMMAEAMRYQTSQRATASEQTAYEIRVHDDEYPEITRVVIEGDLAWFVNQPANSDYSNATFAYRGPNDDCFYAFVGESESDGDFELRKDDPTLQSLFGTAALGIRQDKFEFNRFYSTVASVLAVIDILEIEPGETPTDPWKVVHREVWNRTNPALTTSTLDPTRGFNVIRSERTGDNFVSSRVFETGVINGQTAMTKSVDHYIARREGREREVTTIESVHELTPQEIEETKRAVDAIAKQKSQVEKTDWNRLLVNPYTLAIGWPLLAFLLLGIDLVGERVKIKVDPES